MKMFHLYCPAVTNCFKRVTKCVTIPPPHHGVVILLLDPHQHPRIAIPTGPKASLTAGMQSSSTKPTLKVDSLRSGASSRSFLSSATTEALPKRVRRALGALTERSLPQSEDQFTSNSAVTKDLRRFHAIRRYSASLCLLSLTGRPSFWRPLPSREYRRLRTLKKWSQGGPPLRRGFSGLQYRKPTETDLWLGS